MKNISNFGLAVTKIVEIIYWSALILLFMVLVWSFAGKETIESLIQSENMDFYYHGLKIEDVLNIAAYRVVLIGAVFVSAIFAMIFRNINLILKSAKDSTPFQQKNVRKLKEIGIFSLAIPVVEFIISVILKIMIGTDIIEVSLNMGGFIMGIVVLCLTQIFAYGIKLEKDVEGLV